MSSKATRPVIRRTRFSGVWTRREIWLADMSLTEKALLVEIESLDKLPRGCIASNDYFAEFVQLSPRQIKRYIARLISGGWIRSERFGWNRRRLRVSAKLRALSDVDNASEGQKRPSTKGQNCPPISTEGINPKRSSKTQAWASRPSCERDDTRP